MTAVLLALGSAALFGTMTVAVRVGITGVEAGTATLATLIPALVVALVAAGIHHDLHGTWQGPDARWILIDNGAALEGYPLDPDVTEGSDRDLVAAPRALDLTRAVHGLTGTFVRRFERRRDNCEAHSAVHIESCHDDTLELVTAELPQPIAVAPCRWSVAAPSHLERWHRLH